MGLWSLVSVHISESIKEGLKNIVQMQVRINISSIEVTIRWVGFRFEWVRSGQIDLLEEIEHKQIES
jgi:hypothetical protein